MLRKLRTLSVLADVNTDQQDKGLAANLAIDRVTAGRYGITPQMIDDTLYDAFGQRQVSTMYTQMNQYHVVEEVDPEFWQNPDGLSHIYLSAPGGQQVPLSAFTHYEANTTPLTVNHQGFFPSVTISVQRAGGVHAGPRGDRARRSDARHQPALDAPRPLRGHGAGAHQESLA